ncbi:epsin like ENTH domain-containing protein [Cryptosporidium ubiquitum]|uniref:Epsin like ENTH domain-containing protein n=1 Tax=Cryptosporidium ubiquitum TaxID=857276 RepID=A0A1J4MNF2_9CRYT|nr:epsin like ENTH domain-containing protein [Cryptosporidium ubiquitum]OII74556.1 epsin like ENTH domain-containing protein [Cryptosporidium ubiquitum]
MLDKGLLQSIFGSDSASAPSGYQLNEVTNLSYMQEGICSYLEDYLIKKLKRNDPKVKFKSLRLIKHLCENGNPTFKILAQRHANQIRLCQSYKGPFDPVYGDTLSELVREEAVQCLKSIFSSNNRIDGSIKVGNQTKGLGQRANELSNSSYKDRIHGFGNPNFIDKIEQDSDSMDISQIGSSIVYNAKIGHYNQVVDDLSELVLKVLPNKLINGISNYYGGNYKDTIRPVNNNYQNKPAFRRDFRDGFFNDEISRGVTNSQSYQTSTCKQGNFTESKIEEHKTHSKPTVIVESQNVSNSNTLEIHFVENYCSTKGLILNPSNELLQNSIKEIQKLDIPIVIKMLHNKLIDLSNTGSNCLKKDNETQNSGIDYQTDNHYTDINEQHNSPCTSNHLLNLKSEGNFKIIYKILCLILSMLETNQNTKKHVIEYVNDDFTHLLNQISATNIHCRRKVKQIIETLGADACMHAPHCPPEVELTNNLIDFSTENKVFKSDEDFNSMIDLTDSLLTLSHQTQENSDKKNNLFKNLSIKNHSNKSGVIINSKRQQKDEQTKDFGSKKNVEKSLIDLGIL